MTPTRREFLRCASLAAGFPSLASAFALSEQAPEIVGKEYLEKGLASLAAAHRFRWNHGHHGAAVIAGYYYCRENPLDERTLRAVKRHLDEYIASRKQYFDLPLPNGPDKSSPDRVAEVVGEKIAEFREGAHDVIYGALAIKALRDLPGRATPGAVDGLCRLIRNVRQQLPVAAESAHNRDHPLPEYRNSQDLVDAAVAALLRPADHFVMGTLTSPGNAIHWITHAEALLTLEETGYAEVARKGHRGHRQYINHPIRGAVEPAAETREAFPDRFGAEYWESAEPRKPQGGSWLFGHSFKFPYSLFRILKKTADPARRRACVERAVSFPKHFP